MKFLSSSALFMIHCILFVVAETSFDGGISERRLSNRQRRQIFPGHLAKLGRDAVNKLTKGAFEIQVSVGDYRLFRKSGNYETALKDFESLSPSGVTKFPLTSETAALVGNVGDRTLVLEKYGDMGRPSIRIIKAQNIGFEKERIIYFDD